MCKLEDVDKAEVSLASFNSSNVSPIKAGAICQILLGQGHA